MNKKIIINTNKYELCFKESEIELLREFNNIVETIVPFIEKDTFKINLNISSSNGKDVSSFCILPSDKDLSFLLHKVRLLILKKERTYFFKVKNIIAKNINDDTLKSFLKKLSNDFIIKENTLPFKLEVNGINISNEDIFFEWLNAYEYHAEKDKIQKLSKISDTIGKNHFKFHMIDKLIIKFNCILALNKLIKNLLVNLQ